MSKGFNSQEMAVKLKTKGLSVYPAVTNKVDIYFESSHYNEFTKLIDDYNVKVVFMDITKLNEDDIVENIITDFDVPGSYRRDILRSEIEEYNDNLEKMRAFIGQEQELRVFFSHQGIVYSCMFFNFDLIIIEKEDFLEDLKEEYEEEIAEAKGNAIIERSQQVDKYFEKIRDFLMQSEAFLKCKNKDLRRAFIYRSLNEADELKTLEDPYITSAMMMEVVEDVWRNLKLKNNSII